MGRNDKTKRYSEKMNKKGQVAIWVIIAVVLVASILLYFLVGRGVVGPSTISPPAGEGIFDVQSYLEACTKQSVEEAVNLMLPQGGFVKPKNKIVFNNTDIAYLCENINYYEPCINQHPLLLNEMKEEIKKAVESRVTECIENMRDDFRSKNAKVIFENQLPPAITISFGQDRIFVEVKKSMTITRNLETQKFDKTKLEIESPLYNLASIAVEIANHEASYCYFEFVGYKALYPRYTIKEYTMSQPIRIYTIIDTKSGKEMNTAIRGCAIPPGF